MIWLRGEVAGDVTGVVKDTHDFDLPGCFIGDLVNKHMPRGSRHVN